MMPPTSIDGTDITGATIDGQDVQEITVDGQTVFTAGPQNVFEDFEAGNVNDWTDRFASISITSNAINGSFSGDFTGTGGQQGKPSATYDPSFFTSTVNTMTVKADFIESSPDDIIGVTLPIDSTPDSYVSAIWVSDFGGKTELHETINNNLTKLSETIDGSKFGSTITIELKYDFNANSITGTWFENGIQYEQRTETGLTVLPDVAGVSTFRGNPRVDDFEVTFT